MIFFIILVLFLWLFVMLLGLGRSSSLQLSRERVYVIKGICAVVIVLHHLSYEVSELSLFRHWGGTCRLFVFCSIWVWTDNVLS